jgi:7-cyano-7-deazaguanine synthase
MNMNTKVFALLSGGVDSSTALAIAADEYPDSPIECVTVNYGQRHRREMQSAEAIATHFSADHIVVEAQGLMTGMLVDKGSANAEIPNVSYAELAPGISPTYVSFRNGLMLSILAARAQSWVMQMEETSKRFDAELGDVKDAYEAVLYCGVHADDGVNWAYPDCTPEFIGSMANAVIVGTYNKVRLRAPLQYMDKRNVVYSGLRLKVPFHLTWSCYKGEEKHCGICPTCRSRKDAFAANGAEDMDVCYAA